MFLYMAKRDFADMMNLKDFEMVGLSWITQVGPKCDTIYLYKREGGGDVTQTEEEKAAWLWKQRQE